MRVAIVRRSTTRMRTCWTVRHLMLSLLLRALREVVAAAVLRGALAAAAAVAAAAVAMVQVRELLLAALLQLKRC
jgi:hydroxymethylglutaryl-CoA reductase